ncbi:hypothetical protein JOF56_005736 [Kibdelosporangium banguiense]|uniref:Immunity protein 63 n=1 Tax=Kibdelosporangium banguiense TaxID=1365924 RepID=A0ABS4TLQ5_9PSEU|nr:hypothetical protein [Kibdelosporangium banguiense]MBP2325351.1 hypothetical protein [Kibdelosporangium banguiense]
MAARIMEDLYEQAGGDPVPADIQFSVHVRVDYELLVLVGGLRDAFAYADTMEPCYTPHGKELAEYIANFVESYNWSNPDDRHDRRFVHSVRLLMEVEWRTIFWTPGEIRHLSDWAHADLADLG